MEKLVWHNAKIEWVIDALESDPEKGLSAEEAEERLRKFGSNDLPKEKSLPKTKIFFSQFKNSFIFILLFAGIITIFLKEYVNSGVIFAAVALNAIVGFIQENKASRALAELKKILKLKTVVLRDGRHREIPQEKLVPGDVVILKSGAKVPADGRIIESMNLKISEAVLTGEWLPAEKTPHPLPKETVLADRDNMAYTGTIVEDGQGKMLVTETGKNTELGKIALLIRKTKEEKTPFQKKLSHFSRAVGVFVGLTAIVLFIIGLSQGREFAETFTAVIAIAVAAVPEGLPVALTVILAVGMRKILKKKGLVRRLSSAETLGNTSIIATDKTLTLTQGKMKLSLIWAERKKTALRIAVLCNEAFVENPNDIPLLWTVRGRPTDQALLLAGEKRGINKQELERRFPKIDEAPFNSQTKFIATLRGQGKNWREKNRGNLLFVSGGPEKIIKLCSFFGAGQKQIEKITPGLSLKINQKLQYFASQGLRVIAVAYKKTNEAKIGDLKTIKDMIFVGFLCLKDPLRPDVKEAIAKCRQAGMKPLIVTGDHILTAKAIAKELGMEANEENIIEGEKLDELSEKELSQKIEKITVFARVEPRHKLRIIECWQQKNQVVAMTGDGVNDGPALKRADIGIALGSGTDVAKEVSDLVLLNNSFSIIAAAVEEGRAILDNMRKTITFSLSDAFAEIILVGTAIIFGLPLPLTAVQILWINLIEDGFVNMALAFEPKERDLMKQKPRGHKTPLLTREMKTIIFFIGIFTNIILLAVFFWLFGKFGKESIKYIRTMLFAGLSIDSLFYVFSCKSLRQNVWKINIFSNKFLNVAWLGSIMALLGAVYLPFLQKILGTTALKAGDWIILAIFGIIVIISIETAKRRFIIRKETNQ